MRLRDGSTIGRKETKEKKRRSKLPKMLSQALLPSMASKLSVAWSSTLNTEAANKY